MILRRIMCKCYSFESFKEITKQLRGITGETYSDFQILADSLLFVTPKRI